MFENYNQMINFVIAVVLMISPHFFEDHGLKVEDMRYVYSKAQKQAQTMIETGDMSVLEGLPEAQAELERYKPLLDKMAPVLDKVAARVVPGLDQGF